MLGSRPDRLRRQKRGRRIRDANRNAAAGKGWDGTRGGCGRGVGTRLSGVAGPYAWRARRAQPTATGPRGQRHRGRVGDANRGGAPITTAGILTGALGLEIGKSQQRDAVRVSGVMRKLGYRNIVRRFGYDTQRVWLRVEE